MSTVLARFMGKTQVTTGCHLWTGATNQYGYGVFRDERGHLVLAHRWAWKNAHGSAPKGTLDHLCRTRRCVRVDHLEDVSLRENILRGDGPTAQHARKDRCPKCGGPYTTTPTSGRRCRPCDVEGNRARRGRKRP